MQYISLTTINRLYDVYVYHNLFNPGFHTSYYIPPSKRVYNTKRFNVSDASRTQTDGPSRISFNDKHLLNSGLFENDEEINEANQNGVYSTGSTSMPLQWQLDFFV